MKISDIAFHNLSLLNESTIKESRRLPNVIVVPESAPAIPIAEAAEMAEVQLIVVSGSQGQVTGLVFPEWTRSQIETVGGLAATTLKGALEKLLTRPGEKLNNFHHEWLNQDRPAIFECPTGPHYIDKNPCSQHGIMGEEI